MRFKPPPPNRSGQGRFLSLSVLLVLVSALCGCAVVSVGKAGVSLGATAVKTTGKVGGAAVGAAGAVLGAGEDEARDVPTAPGEEQGRP